MERWKILKSVLLDSEIKLKDRNEELESELKDKKKELHECCRKECIRIFKHMESLNGDFSEYINNADVDGIKYESNI